MVSARSSQLASCLLLALLGAISALVQKDVPQAALATEAPEQENAAEKVSKEKPVDDMKWAQHAPVKGNRSKPRMLVSQGCENNELVIDHARALLKLHGIHTPWRGALSVSDVSDLAGADNSSSSDIFKEVDAEEAGESSSNELSLSEFGENLVSPNASDIDGEADEAETTSMHEETEEADEVDEEDDSFRSSVYRMHNLLHAKGKTMLLKGTIGKDNKAILDKKLVKLGTLAVVVTRKNRIDQLVCMIKDCANESLGYPTQDGNKSDLCYKRHKQETSDYKAFIKPAMLTPELGHLELRSKAMGTQLKNNGYWKVQVFDSEELLDFTFDKNAVARGVNAWNKLLQAWKVGTMPNVIKKYLEQKAGTRQWPSPHKDSILNYDAVQETLGNHSRYSWMLRE